MFNGGNILVALPSGGGSIGVSVAEAKAAAVSAEAARDAAQLSSGVFADTAAGLAATTNGKYFSVPSADSSEYLILYKNNSGSAVEVKRYPAADAVLKPKWAGKINGWLDPFFRHCAVAANFYGKSRWFDNGAPASAASMTLVNNPVFNGKALRKANNGNLFGPKIYLSDMGASPGDTVTIRMLVVAGALGGSASLYVRPHNSGNVATGTQVNGTLGVVTGSTPQLLTAEVVTPAGTDFIWVYPVAGAASGQDVDIVALWAFKGAASTGPVWPAFGEDESLDYRMGVAEADIDALETGTLGSVAYAIKNYGQVTAANTSVTLDGTGFSAFGRDLVFRGWGETFTPAGVSFNAIRCKSINRIAALESSRWRTLRAVVRTGGSSGGAGAPIVAVGSITVLESADTLTDLTILLRDPTTGAVKTLTDADFSGGEYFIGVYAENAAGAPASCGEPRGTMANSKLQSYYITSAGGEPKTAAWVATSGGSNARLAFQHLLLTTPAESVVYTPSSQFVTDAAAATSAPAPEIVMPPYVFGVQGRECNVYFDNLHLADASQYFHDVTSASTTGQQQNERWTWTPSGALASGTLTIAAHDKRTGALLTTKTAQQRAAASSAGSGTNKKVLVIGDSLVNAGYITQTLIDIAAADVMGVTMLGTQGTAPNRHEGRGGWTIGSYTGAGPTYYDFTVSGVTTPPVINSTEYSHNGSVYRAQTVTLTGGAGTIRCSVTSGGAPLSSGTLTKSNGSAGDATITFSASAAVPGNPFWIGGAVNFPQYLTNNSIATPDWVFIALGINDVFAYTSDSAASAYADSAFQNLDTLIASIKAAGAGVNVGLMIPSPPSSDEDSFGANYATGQTRWRFKRNILIWARQLIAKYAGQEANRIYVVPTNTALDTVNNMSRASSAPVNSRSTVNATRQNNGVHPAQSGYQQIGDALWAFLKCNA